MEPHECQDKRPNNQAEFIHLFLVIIQSDIRIVLEWKVDLELSLAGAVFKAPNVTGVS